MRLATVTKEQYTTSVGRHVMHAKRLKFKATMLSGSLGQAARRPLSSREPGAAPKRGRSRRGDSVTAIVKATEVMIAKP